MFLPPRRQEFLRTRVLGALVVNIAQPLLSGAVWFWENIFLLAVSCAARRAQSLQRLFKSADHSSQLSVLPIRHSRYFWTMGRNAKIHTLQIADDHQVTVTLKSNALNLFEQAQENLWTYDLSGRLMGMYVDGENYRRSLDDRFYHKYRITHTDEVFRQVDEVDHQTADPLINRGIQLLKQVEQSLPDDFKSMASLICAQCPAALKKDGEVFRQIYQPITILPPDQYLALVVQLTIGCNYNRCIFCNFYRDRKFRIRSTEDFRQHLISVKSFMGAGLSTRRSIFLADANALVIPQDRLLIQLAQVREFFPELEQLYSFIDVFTGIRKDRQDFAQLREMGIRRVYLGVESGDAELLELLNKPQLTEDIITLARELKEGGIQLGVILLAGAGGIRFHRQHLEQSLKLIDTLSLGQGDMVYISEFYDTNPEYEAVLKHRGIPIPSRQETRRCSNEFGSRLKPLRQKGIKIGVYDIQQFVY